MSNDQQAAQQISVLVNFFEGKKALVAFVCERKLPGKFGVVYEPDMYTIEVGRGLTFKALEGNLHVDFDQDPKYILIFSSDSQRLQGFLDEHHLSDTLINGCPGGKAYKFICERPLTTKEEIDAMRRGLLAGRVDYTP